MERGLQTAVGKSKTSIFRTFGRYVFRTVGNEANIIARDSMYAKRAYAIAIPSVCLSVCQSVRHTGDSCKTVEVRILQSCTFHHTVAHTSSFCALSFVHKFGRVHPERER